MTLLGRLHLLRVLGTPPVFLLGLLLALPLGAQGLSGVRFSAARTAHPLPQKHLTHGILKPAAHLVGYPSKQNSLLWRASTDRAFLRHGFSLSNNSLLIPTSGLYFVYSQVVFSGESCSPRAIPTPIYLAHEVQLFSSQYPFHVPLLSAQKSVYPGLQGPWVRSMYQGAVFLLSKGDQLSTHTDGISHLHFSPSSVFFGAFAQSPAFPTKITWSSHGSLRHFRGLHLPQGHSRCSGDDSSLPRSSCTEQGFCGSRSDRDLDMKEGQTWERWLGTGEG